VRCHILEVDLATQFSPDMQSCLRNTQEDCEKCMKTLADILESEESPDGKDSQVLQSVVHEDSPTNRSSEHKVDVVMDWIILYYPI